jgi:Flp pilus assembly protein TadG
MLDTKQFARKLALKLKSSEAAEIAEVAVVLPIVFIFLFGIIWFGRAFNIYSTITQAAQQGAIAAARDSCATCAGGNTLPGTTTPDSAIYAVMHASNLDVNQMQVSASKPNCGSAACTPCAAPTTRACTKVAGAKGGNFYVCQNVTLNPTAASPQCGTVVSFQYPFQFHVPFTSLDTVLMSTQAESRMEN